MRDYSVHYKNGEVTEVEVSGREELVKVLFNGSEAKLKDEVELLRWQSTTMVYTEDVATGKIDSEITTADTNPYGWRNEGAKFKRRVG